MTRRNAQEPLGETLDEMVASHILKSETAIKREICAALTSLGIEFWRINCGRTKVRGGWMHFAKTGTFDILASVRIVRGTFNSGPHFLWIETKRPGEDYRPEQLEFEIERAARYHMAWRVESVDELLEKIRAAGVIG